MNTKTVSSIRLATLRDVDAITELVNGAYRGESGARGWTTEAHLLGGLRTDSERVSDLIRAEGSVVLLKTLRLADAAGAATGETEIIEGCVHLERQNAATAYLGMLTTNSQRQARGTGSELLKASEAFVARAWQSTRVEMTVITVRTELIDWYVRRGYRVTSEKRPFPADPRFGIPLVESLEFIVLDKNL